MKVGYSIITDRCSDDIEERTPEEIEATAKQSMRIPWPDAEILSDKRVIDFCCCCSAHPPFVAHLAYGKEWAQLERAVGKLAARKG